MATRRGPDGTVRVAIQGNRAGINWANVFWCNLTGGATAPQADLDAWLTSFANAYKTRWQAYVDANVGFGQAQATLFQSGGGALHSVSTMTGAGTQAGTSVSDNACCRVISWNTSVYWRGGKPRTYIPGAVTGSITASSQITTTEATNLQSQAAAFRTDINALVQGAITATAFGFVSFRSGNADRVPPLFYAITGARVHHRLGTQRRRLGPWLL